MSLAQTIDENWIRAAFGRFNDRAAFFADPEGTWIDRPHYRVIPQNLEMRTRDEVVAWFHGFFDSLPDLHMDVEDVAIAGEPGRERVTIRWRITGTFIGAPFMGIAATGRPIDLRGMDLIDMRDGLVAGNVIYFDQLAFARQVGMLPPEGSRRDRLMTRGFNAGSGCAAGCVRRSAHSRRKYFERCAHRFAAPAPGSCLA